MSPDEHEISVDVVDEMDRVDVSLGSRLLVGQAVSLSRLDCQTLYGPLPTG